MFRQMFFRCLMTVAVQMTLLLALLLSVSVVAHGQDTLTVTNPGVGSVTVPAGYDWINVTVQCWAGGGGGGSSSGYYGGGGGGGGAYSANTYTTPLVAGAYSYYVGAGGAGYVPGGNGGGGGNTIWNYGGAQDVFAGGGGGGGYGYTVAGAGGGGGTVGTGTGFPGGGGGSGGYYLGGSGGGGGGGGSGGPSGPGAQGGIGTAIASGSGGAGYGPGGNGGAFNAGSNGGFPGGGGGGGGAFGGPGGQGANGEIVLTYTPVFVSPATWSASGGGSWGTLTSNFGTNWGGAGYGSPGVDLNSPSTDTATFGSSVASGTAAVTLDGASPSLAALTFSNSAASYTLAAGSGGTLHLNGGTQAAALTDIAGSHAIAAPVALDTSASVTVTNPGNTLAISGAIGGSGGLTTSGAGTVVLTASNSYAGGTTIAAGTLALGDGGTTGSVLGGITNNATLLLNFAGNQPFANSVSGLGNVVVSGPGTVTLQAPSRRPRPS